MKILALPFLPATLIRETFNNMENHTSPSLQPLFSYVRRQWMTGFFTPEDWSIFGSIIRTNNDVEGWHCRLNKKVPPNCGFYQLLKHLHFETELIQVYEILLKENIICRNQKMATLTIHQQIFNHWEAFNSHKLTCDGLLSTVSALYTKQKI